jgi:TPR repeat protein
MAIPSEAVMARLELEERSGFSSLKRMAAKNKNAAYQCALAYLGDAYPALKLTELPDAAERAIEYYEMAIEQGHIKAGRELVSSYWCGYQGIAANRQAWGELVIRVARQGNAEIAWRIAAQYGNIANVQAPAGAQFQVHPMEDRAIQFLVWGARGKPKAQSEICFKALYIALTRGSGIIQPDPAKLRNIIDREVKKGTHLAPLMLQWLNHEYPLNPKIKTTQSSISPTLCRSE